MIPIWSVMTLCHFDTATLGSISLVESSDKFLQKHFEAVSESEEFLGAPIEEVSELVERDELHVASEEIVFLAVLRYVDLPKT